MPAPTRAIRRRVVVGMTSIPGRVKHMRPALESIASQTRKPDLIVLSLPERSSRDGRTFDVPPWLEEAAGDVPFVLNRPPIDRGPGTKLLGALGHVGDDDTLVVLDDDNAYADFVVGRLAEAVADGRSAASFYTYRHRGLDVGQGADGLALPGRVAREATGLVPLIERFPQLRLHDDYWIAFLVRRAGCRMRRLSMRKPSEAGATVPLSRRELHDIGALYHLGGDFDRSKITDESNTLLFRHAVPTLPMRVERRLGILRETAGRLRRRLGV